MVYLQMSDGRELMGHRSAAGSIIVVGADLKHPQLAMFVATARLWRPMDEQALEEFERG